MVLGKWEKGEKMYAEAKAGDESKGASTPMRTIVMSKGAYFEPISVVFRQVSYQRRVAEDKEGRLGQDLRRWDTAH